MRVLYDHEFFTAFPYSGITRYFREIMTRIAGRPGNELSVFMGFNTNRFGLENDRRLFRHFFSARRPEIRYTGRLFRALNRGGLALFEKLASPELYHQTYYQYMLPGFRGKRIVTVHDMTYELFPQFFSPHDPAIRGKRLSVEKADGIITVSHSTRNDLMRLWNVPGEKIRVIHLGNSLTVARGSVANPLSEPYVLYVGHRGGHKNFMLFLEAYCRSGWLHGGHRLACFGGGPFTAEERAIARAHGVEARLWQGGGDDALLGALYDDAAALVYPSLYEGFGLPIVEAMSRGCPVVLSRTSSLLEVGREGGAFFDPLDAEDLLERLRAVLSDEALRRDMRERGARHAATFTWEKTALETEAFYRDVLGR